MGIFIISSHMVLISLLDLQRKYFKIPYVLIFVDSVFFLLQLFIKTGNFIP